MSVFPTMAAFAVPCDHELPGEFYYTLPTARGSNELCPCPSCGAPCTAVRQFKRRRMQRLHELRAPVAVQVAVCC